MKDKNLHTIFEQTNCFNQKDMLAYIEGKLSANEQFLFEKHILSCSMCRDEYEGLHAMQNRNKLPIIVSELNSKIDKQLNSPFKKTFLKTYSPLRIAALLLVLIGSGFFINYYLQYTSKEYFEQEMVSQSVEESAEEALTVSKDRFSEPVNELKTPTTELRTESTNNYKESVSKFSTIEPSINDEDSDIALSGAIVDDEMADIETDNSLRRITTEEIVKKEKILAAEGLGEAVLKNNQIISEEIVEEADEFVEMEEDIAYDDKNKGNERKLDDNVNRAKMLSSEKSKKSGKTISYQQKGIDAYDNSNYPEANLALNNSIKYEGKEDKTQFYLGQTYAAQGDSKNALIQLNKVLKNKDSDYKNEAMWEKAQLLIKIGKRKSAINVLNNLLKVKSPYENEAQQKLDSLLIN